LNAVFITMYGLYCGFQRVNIVKPQDFIHVRKAFEIASEKQQISTFPTMQTA